MAVHSLKAVQKIPVSVDSAWNFFSDPANLPAITPAAMSFNIISRHHGEKMYPGQIIEYTVAPVGGIKLYWMTEITHVSEKKFFIDEQRYGPYAMWHHQHHFREIEGGVEMTDLVHYKNPLGFLGEVFNKLVVRPKLLGIFKYRFTKVDELFGGWPEQEMKVEIY
ncbi:MAG: SRPBCC family protein [Chitinophagaceae bacterium]|nr:SRPBCC family protein [Chitinophagaceae bacterium]